MPKEIDEKKAFASRLKQALGRSPKRVSTATDLSIQFNLRHPRESITVQAAQKWLNGTARPTADKIETLAEWLNVSAQWLRYGIAEEKPAIERKTKIVAGQSVGEINEDEYSLLAKLRLLSEHRRLLILDLVDQLSLDQDMWKG